MGNYVSCHFMHPKMKPRKAARVILPSGEILHFSSTGEPITVAEIMLEHPLSFIVDSSSINMGRRFSPLPADQVIRPGHVYLMFPMRRLGSVVTPADVAVFLMSASSAQKRITGNVRVSPDEAVVEQVQEEERVERLSETEEIRNSLLICRSKKPSLDTIIEGKPFCLRRVR